MKTLVVNGCSFVAGDDLVWDQFRRDSHLSDSITSTDLQSSGRWNELYHQYTQYRRSYNLASEISRTLDKPLVDLSQGGQSNDSIAWRTIEYLNGIPYQDRSNHHVIIGWTALARSMKFCASTGRFVDLVLAEYLVNSTAWEMVSADHSVPLSDSDNTTMMPKYQELAEWCRALSRHQTDQDQALQFIKNVMLLEQYCRSHGISYTFFRSMGTAGDLLDIDTDGLTDGQRWLKFPNSSHRWYDSIWQQQLDSSRWISAKNSHPNTQAVAEFAELLSPKIRKDMIMAPART